ncbi:MAG: prolipoprotein diacylglyceryl transferase [Sphingobacteriales bacterium]|nr:MAG: prolipoprotein diacylglyceryl transferase [Sphingobacteriales bacterium]
MNFLQITWNPNPNLIDFGFIVIKYYSVCFMLAFAASYVVVKQNTEYKTNPLLLDSLTIYVFLGTLLGARLGHCLFYDFDYFSQHPLEILLPVTFEPEFKFTGFSGLASHGGGTGILISLLLFSKKHKIKPWVLIDQIALVVPLAGFFIRMGNLMNSEIIGKPTNVSWAFVFVNEDYLPRHPAQLYEAIAYLLIFVLLYYAIKKWPKPAGFYFGLCITLIFIVRFFVEFIKENQADFESTMPINMGQILSFPFIVVGVVIMCLKFYPKNNSQNEYENPKN